MYTYFDYDNDRERVRKRFMKKSNLKTSLKDIGEQLDKFLLDEKAEGLRYEDPAAERESVPSAEKDTSSFEMSWTGRIFKNADPLKPLLLDDSTPLDSLPEGKDTPYRDILDRIKHEDKNTDYSTGTLTPD